MSNRPKVRLTDEEADSLRATMRDIQDSVAAYYAATAEPRELGGEVRNFLTSAQRFNELLAKQIGDSSTYNNYSNHPPAEAGS